MSKATAAIKQAIKAKVGEVQRQRYKCEPEKRVYIENGKAVTTETKPSEADVNQLQILEGQLETLKANLQMVIDREYKEAMNPTPKPAKKKDEVKPIEEAKVVPKGAPKSKRLKPRTNDQAIAAFIDGTSALGGDDANSFRVMCSMLPNWIAEHHFKAMDDGNTIYRYLNGVYVPDGVAVIESLVELEMGDKADNHIANEAIGKIRRLTKTARSDFNGPRFLNCLNGLLEIETLTLVPVVMQ